MIILNKKDVSSTIPTNSEKLSLLFVCGSTTKLFASKKIPISVTDGLYSISSTMGIGNGGKFCVSIATPS